MQKSMMMSMCDGVKKEKKRITLEQRKTIEEMVSEGFLHKDISKVVGINITTLYREFRRCKGIYDAEEAHKTVHRSKNYIRWDIVGKKYGKLTILGFSSIHNHRSWWRCLCECGKECIMSRKMLVEKCSPKRPLSCGCVPKQWGGPKNQIPFEELALRKFQDLLKFRRIKGECWEWTGCKLWERYPRTSWRGETMSVRKCMYLLMNGLEKFPEPVYVNCRNPICFHPDHLTLDKPQRYRKKKGKVGAWK